MLADGRHIALQIMDRSQKDRRYRFELVVYDTETGSKSAQATDLTPEPFLLSPDRGSVFMCGDKGVLRLWRLNGRVTTIKSPTDCSQVSVDWTANMPHALVTLDNTYWLDERGSRLVPTRPAGYKLLDWQRGRSLLLDDFDNLWVMSKAGKRTKVATLDADGGSPTLVWARLSPDGKYVICSAGRAVGEPHINWASTDYVFDITNSKARRLAIPSDGGSVIAPGDFRAWSNAGFVNTSVWDVQWTAVPSLRNTLIGSVPQNCKILDVRIEPN